MGTGVGMLIEKGIEKGLQYSQKDKHEGEGGNKAHNRTSGSHY